MSIVNKTSILRVIALEISEDGAVSKKADENRSRQPVGEHAAEGGLSGYSCRHDRHTAQQLDQYQQAMVEHSLGKRIVHDGVEYSLVGASGIREEWQVLRR